MCVCVCNSLSLYIYIYVCVSVSLCLSLCLSLSLSLYIYIYIYMCVCLYLSVSLSITLHDNVLPPPVTSGLSISQWKRREISEIVLRMLSITITEHGWPWVTVQVETPPWHRSLGGLRAIARVSQNSALPQGPPKE